MTNMFKTFIFLAALTALFMVVGQVLAGKTGMYVALIIAIIMNFVAYWFSGSIALKMSGAVPINELEAPGLHQTISYLARNAGIPKPKVYFIPDESPNAFATGRNPQNAAVAVTRGLMNLLDREEVEGVLAHELAHIKNRDILISSIAAMIAGAISSITTMAQWAMLFGASDDEDGGGNNFAAIIMIIVAPIAAMLIQMAISRSREYLADQTGAQISGRPQNLASALKKIDMWAHQLPMNVNPATAQMYIINPLKSGFIQNLFSTHPPIEERVRRLMELRRV
jgi:heat shock protein HtpX